MDLLETIREVTEEYERDWVHPDGSPRICGRLDSRIKYEGKPTLVDTIGLCYLDVRLNPQIYNPLRSPEPPFVWPHFSKGFKVSIEGQTPQT